MHSNNELIKAKISISGHLCVFERLGKQPCKPHNNSSTAVTAAKNVLK